MNGFRRLGLVLALAVSVPALAACENEEITEPTAITMASLAGTYTATTFTTTRDGSSTNVLADGATLRITLLPTGATTGLLMVPGAGENGAAFEADLAGTFTLSDGVVSFTHAADTFVRDIDFTVAGNGSLLGTGTFDGTTITVILER